MIMNLLIISLICKLFECGENVEVDYKLLCVLVVTEKVWESDSTDASDTEAPPVKEPSPVKEAPKTGSPQVCNICKRQKKK
jgi:hypothetical protein